MDTKKFNLWNRITALLVVAVSLVTYLATMEPTAPSEEPAKQDDDAV